MDVLELFAEVRKLNSNIKVLLNDSGFEDWHELSCVDYKRDNPDECQLMDELYPIMDKLSDVYYKINYLSKPVKGEYELHLMPNGRYACDVFEFTSGCIIEALIYDEYNECHKWVLTSVESYNGEYYLVNHKDVPMDGLKIRLR